MPITEITYQSSTESIKAAYNPIVFKCRATIPDATPENYRPQAVFCDIYVNDVYYKSLWKTYPVSDENMEPEYEFDIQDAMQELMSYNLPELYKFKIQSFNNTIKTVFVRFRNSYIENGYTKSEQTEPIQGTNTAPPVSGGGVQSNSFYVINAGIQPTEPQNLNTLLNLFKRGTWMPNVFPLTKRPDRFKLCKTDSSYFPILSNSKPNQICIRIYEIDGTYTDHCSSIFECPEVFDVSYTVEKVGSDQKFVFDWELPEGYEVAEDLTIYYKLHSSNTWLENIVDVNPTAEMILPLGKYDFKFKLNGECEDPDFDELPELINIGIVDTVSPDVSIYWQKSHTTENKTCYLGGSCTNMIEVESIDTHGIDLDYAVWQESTDGGTTWTEIGIMNSDIFPVQPISVGEHRYRLKAVDISGNSGVSNSLIITVENPMGHPNITNVTPLPNTCPEAGRILNFTIEGDENQTAKVYIEVLDFYGHGADFIVYDDTNTEVFHKHISSNGQIFTDFLELGASGVRTFRGELCLMPCAANNTSSGTAISMTLYNDDNETLSDQKVNWSATMNCY
ncbi:MAG: hypothetical protein WBA59_03910 [Moheibacter sp.]